MKRLFTLLLSFALLQIHYHATSHPTNIVFRIGASIGHGGSCAQLFNSTVMGYIYFINWLDREPPILVTDSSNRTYSLRLQLRLESHDCSEQGRAAAMNSLIHGSPADAATGTAAQAPVHLLLGGHGDNALEDSLQANNASRILMHCCTARDTVFHRGLAHVYGLLTPASLYTGTVLRTMALRGMRRVAVVYNKESLLHVQLCEGALTQLPSLGELRPGFGSVLTVNYSIAEADKLGFWDLLGARVADAGADALIACDEMVRTSRLVDDLHTRGHRLLALWLASSGDVNEFLQLLGGRGEYALTSVQWVPTLPYADPDFGTAAQYAAAFYDVNGHKPSYFSAAATASGYVLLTALQQAIKLCSLGNVLGEADAAADAFMWSEGALMCGNSADGALDIAGTSGTAVLRYILSTLSTDTFFGPVGFNAQRQNIFHPVIVTQVLNGSLVPVLPLDVADKSLVMPIPHDDLLVHHPPKPWHGTAAGISVIALLSGLGVLSAALGVLTFRHRFKPNMLPASVAEIKREDIQVDIPPQINYDGSCEHGEGVYRGTRVKLVVAQELMVQPPAHGSGLQTGIVSNTPRALRERAVGVQLAKPPITLAFDDRPSPFSATVEDVPGAGRQSLQLERMGTTTSAAVSAGCGGLIGTTSISSMGLTGTALQASGGGTTGLSRWQALVPYELLTKCTRRQVQARVWRAIRLQHPRMCPVLGIVWEWPGLVPGEAGAGAGCGSRVPVLVRQWLEFDSLDQLLENETVSLPLLTKATIAQGVAEGLAYLHAQEPPILAGPMDASRVIIDKHFNPHLFLRLENLDPEYGITTVTDAGTCRTRPGCGLAVFGPPAKPFKGLMRQLSLPSQPGPSSLQQQPQQQQPQQQQPQQQQQHASPLLQPLRTHPLGNRLIHIVTAMISGASSSGDNGASVGSRHGSGGGHCVSGGGGGCGGGASSNNWWSQLSGDTLAAPIRRGGNEGLGGGTLQPASPLLPPYHPSKEEDVYEFGLLLCRIFMVNSAADSGWLRFALHVTQLPAAVDDPTGADGGALGMLPWPSAATAPATAVATNPMDTCAMNDVMSYLQGISPDLAILVKSCLQREKGLTFTTITRTLERTVLPSLACGGLNCFGNHQTNGHAVLGPLSAAGRGFGDTLHMTGTSGTGGAGIGELAACTSTGGLRTASSTAASASGGLVEVDATSSVKAGAIAKLARIKGRSHRSLLTLDDLIYDLFPPQVARALQAGETVQPERYDCVSIFFSDVVGYTDLCAQLQPSEVMDLVHRLYSCFDDLIRELRLFKVETVGDAYLAVGNLRWPQPENHAALIAQFALAAIRAATALAVHPDRPELGTVHVRVGLHCGPVVGSVVGTLNRRYCLFGDAVNTAARMEHNSLADRINCSGAFAALLREQWRGDGLELSSRGVMNVKGKGGMELYWVSEKPATTLEAREGVPPGKAEP